MPLFIGLSLSIVFFFLILRYDGLNSGFSKIISILKPFVYGGVIAYLLKTPCNWIEGKLEKLLPTKRQGLAKGLSVISVLLISFLVIYLLMVMIIPALVESLVAIAQGIPGVLTQAEKTVSKYAQDNPAVIVGVTNIIPCFFQKV